jgi:hypothetical protein
MNNVSQIVQKVRQASWRVQRQWIGLFLLGLVGIAMVAAIYLNVTVRATLAGREIQILQNGMLDSRRINSDEETKLAALTSEKSMRQRAEALGFQPARPEDITYVIVPGYAPKTAVDLSSASQSQPVTPIIVPEYTESLFDWFTRKLASSVPAGEQP